MLFPGTGEALRRILYALFGCVGGGIYTKAADVGLPFGQERARP